MSLGKTKLKLVIDYLGNWTVTNALGLMSKCKLEVRNGVVLTIGNNVDMTSTAIICHQKVTIGDNGDDRCRYPHLYNFI